MVNWKRWGFVVRRSIKGFKGGKEEWRRLVRDVSHG